MTPKPTHKYGYQGFPDHSAAIKDCNAQPNRSPIGGERRHRTDTGTMVVENGGRWSLSKKLKHVL